MGPDGEREESSVWLDALWNAYQKDVTRAPLAAPPMRSKIISPKRPAALSAVNGDAAKFGGLQARLGDRAQEPPAGGGMN